MTKVNAGITTSLDGYITGPDDGPGRGLGEGGERLHYWVFGGPWSYAEEPKGEATGADKELLDRAYATVGAVVGGRNTYEAAEAWGGQNPWGIPFFIVTHRPAEAPADAGFEFVNGLDEAIAHAREAAGEKDVFVMGGAVVTSEERNQDLQLVKELIEVASMPALFIEGPALWSAELTPWCGSGGEPCRRRSGARPRVRAQGGRRRR
jgi:dihydrofolate reductase